MNNEIYDDVVYLVNGEESYDEDLAIATLLKESILFCNGRNHSCEISGVKYEGNTTVLFVNCNDIFAWGCADAEDLPYKEIINLYKFWRKDRKWGAAKWCCKIRNQQPQAPVKKDMIKEGSWDEPMEKLPENYYDKKMTELILKKK